MRTKIGLIWMLAVVATNGKPGDLDRTFTPDLRARVAPDHVTVAENGRIWIGGGFERADKSPTGDLVRLGVNGGVADEPATGYLGKKNLVSFGDTPPTAIAPFLLTNGEFLLPGESGGWMRMTAAGNAIGNAFPGRLAGETFAPQFEQAGKLWVIRYRTDGRRVLELRNGKNGTLDSSFKQAADWPGDPSDVVPGPVGTLWVLTADKSQLWGSIEPIPSPAKIFQINESGVLIGAATPLLSGRQDTRLAAGPKGEFRVKYGPDMSFWNYWPAPNVTAPRIDWYDSTGRLLRYQNFQIPVFGGPFCWAEGADGSFLATDMSAVVDRSQSSGFPISLRRYRPDGSLDSAFQSHQNVRSVVPLADGKWLLDGLRRINADGSKDATWKAPQLDRPAKVELIAPLPGGRTLVGGDFATANGFVRNRLAVFRPNGTVDPKFILDDRISEWKSVAVSGRAIYVVTPQPVSYGDGITSNLVKLGMDGALIENYRPEIQGSIFDLNSIHQPITDVTNVHAIGRDEILTQTYSRNEVAIMKIYRLKADGSQVAGFQGNNYQPVYGNLMTRKNGTFLIGGVIYSAKGAVQKDLTIYDVALAPLCETRGGGVLFLETRNGTQRRLRLWANSAWAPWFRAPVLGEFDSVSAVTGESGDIYLSATFKKKGAGLFRLFPNGSIDKSFNSPVFATRERQAPGDWWKAGESGKIEWNVVRNQTPTHPQALSWHPLTRRLWVGGNFNVVNGKPRDGLARIKGGLARGWSWR